MGCQRMFGLERGSIHMCSPWLRRSPMVSESWKSGGPVVTGSVCPRSGSTSGDEDT